MIKTKRRNLFRNRADVDENDVPHPLIPNSVKASLFSLEIWSSLLLAFFFVCVCECFFVVVFCFVFFFFVFFWGGSRGAAYISTRSQQKASLKK